jgi:hypothetical protein
MSFSIAELEEYRRSSDVECFTDEWLEEEREGDTAGRRHMDLAFWVSRYPHQALAILLSLLDKTEGDEATQERIAVGEIPQIVEWPPDDFLPYLVHAVQTHPRFALCTKWMREHPDSDRWRQLCATTSA